MSDVPQGEGWWIASDGKYYAPELHPDYQPPAPPPLPPESVPIGDAGTSPTFTSDPAATPPGINPTFTSDPAAAPPGINPTFTSDPSVAAPLQVGSDVTATLPNDPVYALPETEPTPQASGSRNKMLLGVGALVLLVALGFLLFRLLGGGSAGTGAASPEAAIDQLIASVNDRDVVGLVEIFDPDEAEAWFGSFTPAADRFNELAEEEIDDADTEFSEQIADAYSKLFESFEYDLTGADGGDVVYDVLPLDDDGRISRVRVDGLDFTFTANTDIGRVLIGGDADSGVTGLDLDSFDDTSIEIRDTGRGLMATLLRPGLPPEEEFAEDAHLDLVTVNKDGEWYISIGYSMLEIARNSPDGLANRRSPDFGRAYRLLDDQTGGAETAEEVMRSMVTALEQLDYDAMIQLTDPAGLPYLHDYQPLIDDEVNEGDRRDAARDLDLSVEELDLGISEWEGRTLVTLGAVSGRIADGGTFDLDTTRWCANAVSPEGDRVDGCLEDFIADALDEAGNFDQDPRDFIPEEVGIIVVERNGRYYFDPLGTMGFYADQLAEASIELVDTFGESNFTSSGFLITEGPVARRGAPATAQPTEGTEWVSVAMDLEGYPVISGGFGDELRVALARVTSDGSGTYASRAAVQANDEDWFVVFQDADSETFEIPAIAVDTSSNVTVELFEVEPVVLGPDGLTGQIDDQGRPQIFRYDSGTAEADFEFNVGSGTAQSVFGFEDAGVAIGPDFAFGRPGRGLFTIVSGPPGLTFEVTNQLQQAPPPLPEPTPIPTPAPVDPASFAVDEFELFVNPFGYSLSNEQAGGFFDGCTSGPDDPDVTSYLFNNANEDLVVLTPYPTEQRASDAFIALVALESPCPAYTGLVVSAVEPREADQTFQITYYYEDAPDELFFERHRLAGSTIVVATGQSIELLDAQSTFLQDW